MNPKIGGRRIEFGKSFILLVPWFGSWNRRKGKMGMTILKQNSIHLHFWALRWKHSTQQMSMFTFSLWSPEPAQQGMELEATSVIGCRGARSYFFALRCGLC